MLTAPSETAGTANVDFVIFPERWAVAEHTFRPPWYHMNIMSEFMGLIYGVYDAKPEGFVPGGIEPAQLHAAARARQGRPSTRPPRRELKPVKLTNTLAFMFETRFPQHLTKFAAELETLQEDYADCWTRAGAAIQAVKVKVSDPLGSDTIAQTGVCVVSDRSRRV